MGLAVGVIMLYIFLRYFFNWEESKRILAQADLSLFFLAAGFFVLSYLLRALKWTYILWCRENISWQNGYHATMVCSMTNFFFPIRFGEVIRLFIAKTSSRVSYSASTAASLVDLFSHMFLVLLVLFVAAISRTDLPEWVSIFVPVFLVFLVGSLIIFVLGVHFSRFFRKTAENLLSLMGIEADKREMLLSGRIATFINDFLTQCHISSFNRSNIAAILAWSLFIIGNDGLYFQLLISSFGLSISYYQAVMAACFLNVFFFIPSPPGRVGTAEMYPVLIFSGILLLSAKVIATAALAWHITTTGLVALLGLSSMTSLGLQFKTLLNQETLSTMEDQDYAS